MVLMEGNEEDLQYILNRIERHIKQAIVRIAPIQYNSDSVRKSLSSTLDNTCRSLGRSFLNPAPYFVDSSVLPNNCSLNPMISILPNSFPSQVPSSLSTVRDGWFLNLSSCDIPNNVQCFLQLGEDFALPFDNKNKIIFNCIKGIESGTLRMPLDKKMDIINQSIPILKNIISSPVFTLDVHKQLTKMESETRLFLSAHPNIVFTRADKGNVTVAIDRDAYKDQMITLLGDSDTYVQINKDPTKKLTTALRSMLTRWKTGGYIGDSEYRALYCSDGSLPRAYGLPKIHKPGCPLRIIVSSMGSPLYSLAAFLQNKLFKTIPKTDSNIKNSFELVEKLRNVHFTGAHELISLDVTSLFTNVPIDLAIDCINEHWHAIARDCSLPKKEFLGAIKFVLDSTFFSFDDVFYRQCFGTPMGSPISPIIADLVMRRLETVSLMSSNVDTLFYYRYVDDICTAVHPSQIDRLLKHFNSFHPRLQFTVERGGNAINFLDITVLVNENQCYLDWYRKPTFSGRFLNFHSNHPLTQKKGTIFSLVDRAFLLSDSRFHTKNLTFIINILLLNDYPLDFIFDTMNHRIKNLIKKIHNVHNVTTENDITKESTSWLTVPFVPSHTERFRALRKNKGDIRIAFHSPNKMNKYIRVQKDTCPRTSKNNVVYKIRCNNCDASYVGQTGRKLKTRIAEHRNHIRYKTSTRSVITEHRLLYNHDFQWDDVQILDEEPSYRKRLISEMLHIKKQKNSLNLQTDTESLHKAYIPIINKV
ncbi:PREDICTED: uncharacterized protein LOC108751554 [Trachymyrmex septentrionalis]|uniref:uncharacterized protein LOC108751554 n=1 Tax=Trachymyrmex septentrionalis TaxID=34720 RepID=UPI00084F2112|nr:PREDICTED: uncharacterized protein LOC108751554 [Trachymyrmex septentrionalis]